MSVVRPLDPQLRLPLAARLVVGASGTHDPMTATKKLWRMIHSDPVFMRRVNGWLTVFWVAMIPVSYELGWLKSVVYVSALSLWALVAGHWSTWQAARVEVEQQQQADKHDADPVEKRVVDAMIQRTDVEAAEGLTSQ